SSVRVRSLSQCLAWIVDACGPEPRAPTAVSAHGDEFAPIVEVRRKASFEVVIEEVAGVLQEVWNGKPHVLEADRADNQVAPGSRYGRVHMRDSRRDRAVRHTWRNARISSA